ncbi:MAG: hypothetical protein KC983_05005, partial [Phycisphaerales bacterium]|nr:hypothetical protein [Phycisphaerales bacterium]
MSDGDVDCARRTVQALTTVSAVGVLVTSMLVGCSESPTPPSAPASQAPVTTPDTPDTSVETE